MVASSASSDKASASETSVINQVFVRLALPAGDCRGSVIECNAAGAVGNEISARRTGCPIVFSVISIDAGIAGLCRRVAVDTHFDLLPAGNALSTIVQYIIAFDLGADFEGGDGIRIALEAMRSAPIA